MRLFAYGVVSPIPVEGQCVCEVSVLSGVSRKVRFCVGSQCQGGAAAGTYGLRSAGSYSVEEWRWQMSGSR